jgi:hypothetical protein
MENKKSIQYIQVGLISFFVLLVICIFIRPAGLGANSGVSYYGGYSNTLLPYSLAFLVESVILWRAASMMNKKTKIDSYISSALKVFAILFIGILITPHTVLGWEHRTIGSTLFSLQLIMGIILVFFVYRDWLNVALLITVLLSGLASLIYLLQPNGFMIQSQIIFQISIWIIFIRSLWYSDSRLDE